LAGTLIGAVIDPADDGPAGIRMREAKTIECQPTDGDSLLDVLIQKRAVLLKAAASITGCRSRAEDVLQDAYLRLVTVSLSSLSAKARISYVFQVIRNLAIDHYRKQELEQRYVCTEEESLDAQASEVTPDSIQASEQTFDIINEALKQLPSRTRYAFEMYRLHGMQQKAIAKQLGVSPTLVNFLIRDALVHCKHAVEAQRTASCSN
jgi:RNA polymerase sigma factor (sigma-70 family)